MRKEKLIFLLVAVGLTAAIIAAIATYYITIKKAETGEIYLKDQTYEELQKYFEIGKIKELIHTYYFEETDENELISGALQGMVNGLHDGESALYNKEEYRYFDENSLNSLIGEGMLLRYDAVENKPYIYRVLADTPAYDAGMQSGDRILKIDEYDASYMDVDLALGLVRGTDGTTFTITVQTGQQEPRELTITRKTTNPQMVFTDMLNEQIGYINIVEFSGDVATSFANALLTMEKENAKGAVVDLRGLQRGNMSNVVEVLDLLLPEGEIAYVMSKGGKGTVWATTKTNPNTLPLTIIVDEQTTGVSEVFAAVLQEKGRASIVGQNTAGKAYMSTLYQLEQTGHVLKLVTGVYYTAGDKALNENGVVPEIFIDTNAAGDAPLQEAAAALKAIL